MALAEAVPALVAPALGLSRLVILKSGVVFLVTFALAALEAQRSHPFPRFGPANTITTLRLAFVAMLAATLGESYSTTLAWSVTAITVGVTVFDGVDGWIARRSGLGSAFGARFDMETDALLLMVLAVLAWRWDRAGVWVIACGLMRYVFVAAGWVWRWIEQPLPPSLRRKTVCVVQIVTLGVIVAPIIPHWLSVAAAAVTLVLLAWSFAVDLMWLARWRGEVPAPADAALS
jgi:phosphatidylglycerophosphate synthase